MNSLLHGWRLGGQLATRLSIVYLVVASVVFYLEGGFDVLRNSDDLYIVGLLGTGLRAFFLTPFLTLVPLLLARLAGSCAGLLTALLAGLFDNRRPARVWGYFCFSLPPVIFHHAANLRPQIIFGEHWLNSYWFWVGVPSLICVFVGGWVGEQLCGCGAGKRCGRLKNLWRDALSEVEGGRIRFVNPLKF